MGAVQMACSTAGTDRDVDTAFDNIADQLRVYNREDFALSTEGCVTPLHVRDFSLRLV